MTYSAAGPEGDQRALQGQEGVSRQTHPAVHQTAREVSEISASFSYTIYVGMA